MYQHCVIRVKFYKWGKKNQENLSGLPAQERRQDDRREEREERFPSRKAAAMLKRLQTTREY